LLEDAIVEIKAYIWVVFPEAGKKVCLAVQMLAEGSQERSCTE